jgi:hypothetical protein
MLIKRKSVARKSNGQFAAGNPGGPGRPTREAELNDLGESANIRAAIRRKLIQHGLLDRAIEMAAGKGRYSKLGPKTMHQMFIDLFDRSISKPPATVVSHADVDANITVKRIIGVNYDDV